MTSQPTTPPTHPSAPDIHLPSICVVGGGHVAVTCLYVSVTSTVCHGLMYTSCPMRSCLTMHIKPNGTTLCMPSLLFPSAPIQLLMHPIFQTVYRAHPLAMNAHMDGCMDACTNSRLRGRWPAVRYWPGAVSGWPCACGALSWYAPCTCPWAHTGFKRWQSCVTMDRRWGRRLWAVHIAKCGTILVCIWEECHRAVGGQRWSLGESVGGSSSISMSLYGSLGKDSNSRLLRLNGEGRDRISITQSASSTSGNRCGHDRRV